MSIRDTEVPSSAPEVPGWLLQLLLCLLASLWIACFMYLLGHPILSIQRMGSILGLAAWTFVWLVPYSFLAPHQSATRRLYFISLALSSSVWLIAETVLHRSDFGWLREAVFHFPLIMPTSGLLFVVAMVASRRLEAKGGATRRRVLILGSGARASIAWRELRTRYYSKVHFLGFVDDRPAEQAAPDLAGRLVSGIDDLPRYLLDHVVDEIVIAAPFRSCYDMIEQVVRLADGSGIHVRYMRDIVSSTSASRIAGNFTLFHSMVPPPQTNLWHALVKRTLDASCAAVLVTLLSPVFLLLAITIKLASAGPVFFVQDRMGYRRRRFKMLRFRTRARDAETAEEGEPHNEIPGSHFIVEDDPRITRLGRFLINYRLDELPQLFNVLLGEMSLVGPRPMTLRQVELITEPQMLRRFSVRPGMTGVWQIKGRSAATYQQWLAMESSYIDRWSVQLDLQILALTVPAVFRRSGAL